MVIFRPLFLITQPNFKWIFTSSLFWKRKASEMARRQRQDRRHNFWQNRTLKILVDMDGVLCDFEGHFLNCYQEKHPQDPYIPLTDRKGFYISDQYESLFGKGYKDKVDRIIETEHFYLNIPPIKGAVDAVKEMSSMDDVTVFICTSPILKSYKFCVKEKYQWVAEQFGEAWQKKIVLTSDKTVVNGDLLIDDKPKIKGIERNPPWRQVLFSACHNQQFLDKYELKLINWTDGSWQKLIENVKRGLS